MPDFKVKTNPEERDGRKAYATKVGVGFRNKAGGINVIIDDGISVSGKLSLWPWEDDRDGPGRGGSRGAPAPAEDLSGGGDFGDDDIPFAARKDEA